MGSCSPDSEFLSYVFIPGPSLPSYARAIARLTANPARERTGRDRRRPAEARRALRQYPCLTPKITGSNIPGHLPQGVQLTDRDCCFDRLGPTPSDSQSGVCDGGRIPLRTAAYGYSQSTHKQECKYSGTFRNTQW